MIKLNKEQVLLLHEQLIFSTGGIRGVRDNGLLESALLNPFQSFGGRDLYPGIQSKAIQLCYGLIKNHPMYDGNKRLGTHVMLTFLKLNGFYLEYTMQELQDVILALAAGNMTLNEFATWVIPRVKREIGKSNFF